MADSEPKKFETRVIGPGLATPAKKASAEGRGGSVIVGRVGGAADTASSAFVVVMFL